MVIGRKNNINGTGTISLNSNGNIVAIGYIGAAGQTQIWELSKPAIEPPSLTIFGFVESSGLILFLNGEPGAAGRRSSDCPP
jgi:hypothetical protein